VEADHSPAIRLSGISKRFGDVTAVEDVSLEVPSGSLVTLLGPSGCGKTTLLRMLAGFEQPSAGAIEIDGRDVAHDPPERRPVNLVFQRYALFPHKNVLENVLFGLEAAGVRAAEARTRAYEFLRICRIDDLAVRRVSELSGGQAQRVAVARALVNRPKVLLLDEPLAALDLKLRRHLQIELRRLQRELGMPPPSSGTPTSCRAPSYLPQGATSSLASAMQTWPPQHRSVANWRGGRRRCYACARNTSDWAAANQRRCKVGSAT
jgi:ABC-type Fe3+/spermidine/putrescine transport system ATPase subunit